MNKCNCYQEIYNKSECWGTKERDVCSCGGDESKCNFYPEKRSAVHKMTVFEKIKSMNVEEFTKWFYENCTNDDDPVIKWWNDTYCKNCPSEIGKYEDSDREMEFCWCELHDGCRFFPEMKETPDNEQMIKLWLESKCEEVGD